MKKRGIITVLSLLLAVVLIIGTVATGIGSYKAGAASEYVSDGGFETSLWSGSYWTLGAASGNYWDNATIDWYAYADDSYLTPAEGDYCFKYYLSSAVSSSTAIKVTQNVSLSAGTYTFTILSMGDDGGQVAPIINGSVGTFTSTDGWNSWQELSYTITLSSAVSNYTIGFAVIGSSGAWGYVDGLSIQSASSSGSVSYGGVSVNKVSGLASDFYLGVDVSSIISLENSGVKFYDWTGSYEQDIFKTLAQAGVNCVRVRIWNDPYNSSTGKGYGGGNCDLDNAVAIAKRASAYGLKLLVDFHFSDFWCDPGKQYAPKAWSSYSVSQKSTAIYNFCYSSLNTLKNNGANIAMVQIGNETTNGFCGESSWSNITTLMSSGCSAVRAFSSSVKIVIHFTNPESGNLPTFAGYLNTYGVDYDVFATSYYPYWHGTLTNLTGTLTKIAETYNKKVMVAETGWPFTYTEGDGQGNNISSSTGITETYAISTQGQATEVREVINAVNNATNGIGVFYWEPAWIPVNNLSGLSGTAYNNALAANKTAWETYGSGWASSAAGEYQSDAAQYYGGSSWENQAMFSYSGVPSASLMVFNLVRGNSSLSSVSGSSTTTTTTKTSTTTTTASSSTTGASGLDGYYYIKAKSSGLYLNTQNDSANNSAILVQETGDGAMAQRFRLVSTGTAGVYYIYTGASNYTKVLDVNGKKTADGTSIIQYTYSGSNNQQFKLVKVGNYYAILTGVTSYASGFDVYNWSTTAGDPINQYAYWGGDCQLFSLESCSSGSSSTTTTTTKATTTTTTTTTTKATTTTTTASSGSNTGASGLDGYYYIKAKSSGLYLNTQNDSASNSAILVQETGDGAMAQRFRLVSTGTAGVYYIYTGASNYTKVLDVNGKKTADGTSIIQYTYSGSNNQQFKLVKVGNYYAILTGVTSYASGFDVYNWSTTAGDPINQYGYWGGDCQLFSLEACSEGSSSTTTTTTKAATTTTTTKASSSNTASTTWKFSDSGFSSLGTISSTKTVNGLTLNASSSKTMEVKSGSASVGGTSYSKYLALGGSGANSYRSMSCSVSGTTTVSVVAKSSGSATRSLVIKDASGNTLATLSCTSSAQKLSATINYTGTIYIYSSNSGINVWALSLN